MRIALNGFGRIGHGIFRVNLQTKDLEIAAVNDLGSLPMDAHLLKFDSIYGTLENPVSITGENKFKVDDQEILFFSESDPFKLPWKDLGIDVVIEATGVFRDRESAAKHLAAGAKKVIITAPAKKVDRTIVMGVNEETYNKETDFIISNASCTTNCLAPVAKILHQKFGIKKGLMTTIHAYTLDQKLLDSTHKEDFRRARAAGLSMIPTSTGAAKALGEVLPELKGKLDGFSIRVPLPAVSVVDLVCELEKETTPEEINSAFKDAAQNELKGILGITDLPLVSCDYKGCPLSAVVDAPSTMVVGGNLAKVLAWYDNEWGYCVRTVDLCKYIGK